MLKPKAKARKYKSGTNVKSTKLPLATEFQVVINKSIYIFTTEVEIQKTFTYR